MNANIAALIRLSLSWRGAAASGGALKLRLLQYIEIPEIMVLALRSRPGSTLPRRTQADIEDNQLIVVLSKDASPPRVTRLLE